MIVEKVADHKPFELHTTLEDKIDYYQVQRNAYLSISLLTLLLLSMCHYALIGFVICLILLIVVSGVTILLQKKVMDLKKQSNLNE